MILKLTAHPLFGVVLSLAVFIAFIYVQKKFPSPFLNPLFMATVVIIAFLVVTKIPYENYNQGGKLLSFFITPATVALAIPLEKNFRYLHRYLSQILVGICLGIVAHALVVFGLAVAFKFTPELTASVLPKSITTAISMGVAESLGGVTSLAVACVVMTGISGVVLGPTIFKLLKIDLPIAQGLSLGTGSHAVGTTVATSMGEVQGAMAGLAIVVTGVLTSIFLPLVWPFMLPFLG